MAQLISLSNQDLAELRGELDAGRAPTVWFTPAAVGVAAGGSAKVVAFTDPAEGDYVQVRPTGSKDVLSFSPSELTRTRPPRKRSAAKPAARPRTSTPKPTPAASVAAPPKAPPVGATAPSVTVEPKRPAAAQPAAPKPAQRRAARSGARTAKATEVTVTLNSTAAGEWTVEVLAGKKRTVRAVPVPPGDVAKAARSLPPAVSEAIDAALSSAREQQQAKVEQLRAELEQAQRALKDLG